MQYACVNISIFKKIVSIKISVIAFQFHWSIILHLVTNVNENFKFSKSAIPVGNTDRDLLCK